MIESENAGTNNPRLTVPWIIVSLCTGVIGFSIAFVRLPIHSGQSVLGPATWIDRYAEVMTHPIMIIIEVIWLCAALSLIHISEPTRRTTISYAVFCLKKKKNI